MRRTCALLIGLVLGFLHVGVGWAGDYYSHGNFPAPSSPATSASMRAEFDLIAAGFAKLPSLAGNANKVVIINGGATGLTTTTGQLALAGNFTITGAFNTILAQSASTTLTLPGVSGTLATLAGSEILTNKTLITPSITAPSGLISADVGLGNVDNTSDATKNSAGATLANKTLTTPIINGGTLSSATLSGTFTGTYTLAGTGTFTAPTLTSPVITTGTVSADPSASLGIASKQYVDTATPKNQDFRLSLTTAVPVTTNDVTAAGTLYAVPYFGNSISLYTGSAWVSRTSAQFSLALTLTSGKPYDVFVFDNASVPTLEVLVWTNDTTRATALNYQDGVLIKSGDATRRYIGSLYASGANTTEDSVTKRYLWNYYHRVIRDMRAVETANTWNYSTATYRQANANAANQLDFIIGISEDIVETTVYASAEDTTDGNFCNVGIGIDSTTVDSSQLRQRIELINGREKLGTAIYRGTLSAGRHTLVWLEISNTANTTSWVGDAGVTGTQSGIIGSGRF